MKFFDRQQEIAKLKEIEEISKHTAQFTIITGRRRIGKTELVRKAYEDTDFLYFFVARKAEADLCAGFMEEIGSRLEVAIPDGVVASFSKVFEYVMELSHTRHFTLFIDEFQDFLRVNPSIFSEMQNIWDRHKDKSKINLIVAGSVNTLMNKIFRDRKEPLFGRQTAAIHVRPFAPTVMKEILTHYYPKHSPLDLLALYALTGGVAKYIEIFIDNKKYTQRQMLEMYFARDSFFLYEGKNLLIEEFGKDYGTYFSILTFISEGANTRAEIEDKLGGKELSGYLRNLTEEYELLAKQQPMFTRSNNRDVRYAIKDQFLRFWFRFVYKYAHFLEAEANNRLLEIANRDFATFTGSTLESYFIESLKEQGTFTRLGYWHDRKGENEIDIIAEDELEKKVQFIEVKRNERNIDISILRSKADAMMKATKAFTGYDITYRGLSPADM